jgi:hypothetical protein
VGYTTEERGRSCQDTQPAASPCGNWVSWRRFLTSKGIGKQAENVGVEVSRGHSGGSRGVDLSFGKKRRQGGQDSEASQRSAATFQNRIGRQVGSLGRRQGRGAHDGRCAARKNHGQTWARQRGIMLEVARLRWNQCRC